MADFELTVKDGGIYWGDQRVSIKGINWFGMETDDFALHGLWSVNMLRTLDFVAEHFNAIRLPFSAELALNMDEKRPGNINYGANPELEGLTTGQVMDKFIQECALRGLLVMLDLHRLEAAGGIPDLWYSAQYPEALVLQAWKTIVLRYKDCWNVFAADLNNEPHGVASWGDGALATDWHLAAQRLGAVVQEANPKLLIFVEGVESHAIVQPGEACWWGGHVAAAEKAPVELPVPNKLVYSPHVYGPDVHAQEYFNDSRFPANMPDIWTRHFGFVKSKGLGPAICAGEWGGFCREGTPDETWQQALADWFKEQDITDSFYWCLNPNSGDTGGVLGDDWVTPNEHKLAVIAAAHPNPTQWPRDPVQPAAPPPEACTVEGAIDPAAAGPPAAAAAAAAGGATAAPAAPPSGEVVYSEGMLQVVKTGGWTEGADPCHQLDIKVVNNTGGVVPGDTLTVKVTPAPGSTRVKSWNCRQGDELDGVWCFQLPMWVGQSGGLVPGGDVVLGVIVKGELPQGFSCEQA